MRIRGTHDQRAKWTDPVAIIFSLLRFFVPRARERFLNTVYKALDQIKYIAIRSGAIVRPLKKRKSKIQYDPLYQEIDSFIRFEGGWGDFGGSLFRLDLDCVSPR